MKKAKIISAGIERRNSVFEAKKLMANNGGGENNRRKMTKYRIGVAAAKGAAALSASESGSSAKIEEYSENNNLGIMARKRNEAHGIKKK